MKALALIALYFPQLKFDDLVNYFSCYIINNKQQQQNKHDE